MHASAKTAILVVNAGSSSIKFALFDMKLAEILSGSATEIGGNGQLRIAAQTEFARFTDHRSALNLILEKLDEYGMRPDMLAAAAHRVVHGGAHLTASCRISPQTRHEISRCSALAPLHNPANLEAIDALSTLAPDLPQFASFDTAFHATNPIEATDYALPRPLCNAGIRRYGFHGISYAALVDNYQKPLPKRLLALHLGNGASLCAIHDGKSVATTMGYSPVSGLVMGTRVGDIDANAVLALTAQHGIDAARDILNRQSGLLALAGTSDLRAILASDTAKAVKHFTYWITRHAGSMIAAMGGLDGIAFTGGIGENAAPIRAAVMQGLAWTGLQFDPASNAAEHQILHTAQSAVSAHIVPAREERQIAKEALYLLHH